MCSQFFLPCVVGICVVRETVSVVKLLIVDLIPPDEHLFWSLTAKTSPTIHPVFEH